jgi:demethylmenaquinone methyltransferase / 2-methoxy-6-polyprenyl-1,4-benzoquinol methylase
MMADNNTTHFGYKQVPVGEKARHVAEVFHSVAGRYDLMNDLMSLGIHRLWKHITLQQSGVRRGAKVLDIAGGTGDLTAKFADLVGPGGKVVLADINASMLNVGRDRLTDKGKAGNIEYVQANAEALPFPDNSFDVITIAFGLRNVTDKDKALCSMLRVLKPGGQLLVLEYSFKVLPQLGKIFTGDADSYQYLAESIRMHPDQQTLKTMMIEAGFERCEFFNMTAGIVALHRGYKF